jgi:predicted HTH domain antitoxin
MAIRMRSRHDLPTSHAREPREEIVHACSVLDVLGERVPLITRAPLLLGPLASSDKVIHPERMQITVDLSDDIARHSDPGREALEALAIEGYRSGTLTHYQASQLLGMSRFECDGFLKSRQIYDHAYNAEDFEQDLAVFRQLEDVIGPRLP